MKVPVFYRDFFVSLTRQGFQRYPNQDKIFFLRSPFDISIYNRLLFLF